MKNDIKHNQTIQQYRTALRVALMNLKSAQSLESVQDTLEFVNRKTCDARGELGVGGLEK